MLEKLAKSGSRRGHVLTRRRQRLSSFEDSEKFKITVRYRFNYQVAIFYSI